MMLFIIQRWRAFALLAVCIAGVGLYALGKHEGRRDAMTEQLHQSIKAERERTADDAKLRNLSDYDFCTLALRRRGLPVEQCDELRGMAGQ